MTSFSRNVAASSDDAIEIAGSMTLNGATITLNANDRWGGLFFDDITIGQGDTINTASITFPVSGGANDDPHFDIYAETTDDASTFTSSSNNISGRSRTTAKTTWNATGVGAGAVASPDIAAVIQEIVDRAGWASGNGIAILLDCLSTNSFRFDTVDSAATITLNIDYTAGGGGGGGQPARSMHQYRQRGL